MAPIFRSKNILAILFISFCLSLFSAAFEISPGSCNGYFISSRVKVPGTLSKAFGSPGGKISNVKVILNGVQSVTFLRPDGYCSLYFPDVRVDVSARNPGKVEAALTETRTGLSELVLEPLRDEQYYEVREPFSIMSIVKSPMGLMVGFMVVVVFLMPKLMENMDPEEMRHAQEEMRNQVVPSLANLLSGSARA